MKSNLPCRRRRRVAPPLPLDAGPRELDPATYARAVLAVVVAEALDHHRLLPPDARVEVRELDDARRKVDDTKLALREATRRRAWGRAFRSAVEAPPGDR
jgi:hypothetical protein